ncbi:MAG: type II secretion system F family protein [Candidatus Omnitrophica bacterium]|nr:type II secretion system F family protein [Candidatus Omnitrophota bacterium]
MIITFTRQLFILMKAGIPLLKALQIVCTQLPPGKFRADVESVIQDIQQGKSFSEALTNYRRFFSLFYINMIKAAEVSGNLTGILKELSQHLTEQRRISRQVQSAFMYPIFVLVIATVILVVLFMFVLPVFTRIFEDLGGKLPPATAFLISITNFASQWGWLFLFLVTVIVTTLILLGLKTNRGRYISNLVIWRIPILGHLAKSVEIARFCRTQGTLLSSGVTLVKGFEVLLETTPSVLLRQAIAEIQDSLEQGDNLSSAMEETGIFPLTLVKMIQVGEESGKIADLFLDAAEDYEEEVSFAVSGFLSVLEPVLIVVMGAIVGFIVISLFFPIFTLSGLVK